MYKVFINDKPVILANSTPDHHDEEDALLYSYKDKADLKQLIYWYERDESNKKLIIINTKNFNLLRETFISLFEPSAAAGGIVYHPQKGMLWILRHNRWDLPKGKIDTNELTETAAIREVEEETGITHLRITDALGPTYHAYIEHNKLVLKTSQWFKMVTDNPEAQLVPQTKEHISRVEWVGENSINRIINSTYASLQGLAREFVSKYTHWVLR